MESPIKMGDLGVPLFLETPIWVQTLVSFFEGLSHITDDVMGPGSQSRMTSQSGWEFDWRFCVLVQMVKLESMMEAVPDRKS